LNQGLAVAVGKKQRVQRFAYRIGRDFRKAVLPLSNSAFGALAAKRTNRT
jgi:hypothetical protein